MKYRDKHTNLINFKFKNKEVKMYYATQEDKNLKNFSKKILQSGVDPDFWSLLDIPSKIRIMNNYNFYKAFENSEDDLLKFVNGVKYKYIEHDKLREFKLNRLLK